MTENQNPDSDKYDLNNLRDKIPKALITQVRNKSLLAVLIPWIILVLFYASPEQIRFSNLDIDKTIANLIWQLPLTAYGLLLLFNSPRERLVLLLSPPITLFLSIALLGVTQGSITSALQLAFTALTSTDLKLVNSQQAKDGWKSNTYYYISPTNNTDSQCIKLEKRLTEEFVHVRILNRLERP